MKRARITVKRSAVISFAMAKRAKDDSGFNVKHASARSTNAKGRCSTTGKRTKKIFWNVYRCWLKACASAVSIAPKGSKRIRSSHFLREAAAHAEQVEAILLDDYQISRAEIDGLWTYVGRKEAEKTE